MTKYRTKEYKQSSGYITFGGCYDSCGHGYASDKTFDNYEDAVKAAKKTARETKEDVEIWTVDSVVKFPDVDYEVVKVSAST